MIVSQLYIVNISNKIVTVGGLLMIFIAVVKNRNFCVLYSDPSEGSKEGL